MLFDVGFFKVHEAQELIQAVFSILYARALYWDGVGRLGWMLIRS